MLGAAASIAAEAGVHMARGYVNKRAYDYGSSRASKRRRVTSSSGGVRFSKEVHRVGRNKRKTRTNLSDLMRQLERYRLRWQSISPSLIGPGKIPIGYGKNGATALEVLPIHFISLTGHSNGLVNSFKGSQDKGLCRVIRDTSNGFCTWQPFKSQLPAGVTSWSDGYWEPEEANGQMNWGSNAYHKWTEVRANFYGSKYMPLTYTITILQCDKSFDPFQADMYPQFQGEFSEFSRWMEDVSRGLIANPINVPGTKPEYKGHIKVIKQYKVNIGPLSYSDAADEGTAPVHVGNVRQFKCFLRHDRWRDYNWAESTENVSVDRGLDNLGWDQINQNDANYCDVKWGSRLFMFITCTSGPRVDSVAYNVAEREPYGYVNMPAYEGTYDLLVRNEFMTKGSYV